MAFRRAKAGGKQNCTLPAKDLSSALTTQEYEIMTESDLTGRLRDIAASVLATKDLTCSPLSERS